ncbi:MAG TPA: hypothetical protein VLY46_13185 [Usitatibacter sp.]|nr:hypothetical protein [Usitatibacter sp.]
MSVVPAPSISATESVAAIVALVLAIAIVVAVMLQPAQWGVPAATSGDACSYNCMYMP